ncbi:MAG: DUF3843 family protein [Prevotella sp.]|nr:DUF3843 family protein [Prevotella sp.]
MAKKLHAKAITAGDIKKRHPRYLNCETDKQYAELAKDIYDLLYDELDFMDDVQIKHSCISLALYFEDLHSNTHLFETFTKLYKEMFGRYVPFYSSKNADSPQARLDAMKFMLWHAIAAERDGMMLNPTNLGLANMAERLLKLWDERKDEIQPNEELAGYLYSEETQESSNEVKMVLIWLSLNSLLGRWYSNPNPKDDEAGLGKLFSQTGQGDKETLEYANECHIVFNIQTWPLSLTPQHIYAEMIRIDMDDPKDDIADSIEKIKSKPFGMFQIVDSDNMGIKLKDFLGETFRVEYDDFVGDARKLVKKHTHILASFIKLNKRWELNGPSFWMNPSQKHAQMYLDDLKEHHSWMHDYVGQYDWLINKHHGERLYFFRNAKEYLRWVKDEMGMKDTEIMSGIEDRKEPMACFFEYNGQTTCCFDAENIKHPDNPSYDKSYAEENSLTFIGGTESCSPDMLLYMLEHNLQPDAMFNDIKGRQHGRKLMQENLEFVARCMRRDIKSTKVFHKRTDWNENEGVDVVPIDKYQSKMSYDNFIDAIDEENIVLSKARKEWQVVRVDNTKTIIRDVDNRKDYEMRTRDLYEAHLHLEKDEIQIATVAPFVGKENASAASALLYNIVGQGQAFNNLRKYAKEIFNNLKMK